MPLRIYVHTIILLFLSIWQGQINRREQGPGRHTSAPDILAACRMSPHPRRSTGRGVVEIATKSWKRKMKLRSCEELALTCNVVMVMMKTMWQRWNVVVSGRHMWDIILTDNMCEAPGPAVDRWGPFLALTRNRVQHGQGRATATANGQATITIAHAMHDA